MNYWLRRFKVGDVVCSIYNPKVRMTVCDVLVDFCNCIWFNEFSDLQEDKFPMGDLKKIS